MPTPQNTSVSNVDVSNIINQNAPPPGQEAPPAEQAPAEQPPAAAPAAAPAEEKPTDAPVNLKLDLPVKPVTVQSTGVDAFDTVGKIMAEKGMQNANNILSEFAETGELSLESKASMIDALGETVAAMAFTQMESAAEGIVSSAKADSAKTMDYANTKFAGENAEQTWGEIQAYVRGEDSPFSDADLDSMNAMLDAGGLQAELVIDRVHQMYNADPNVSTPGILLEGDTNSNGLTFEPISRADYTAAMGKAVREHGEDSPQVRDLDRRRTQSMNRGY